MYLCGPRKHNCQPFCGPEGGFDCSDSVCSLRPAPFSYLWVRVRILCVCWKLSAAEQIKPDCCHTPAVVSIFDRLRCLGHCLVLHHHRSITWIFIGQIVYVIRVDPLYFRTKSTSIASNKFTSSGYDDVTKIYLGSGDSSVVRTPNSWLKGHGFESWQENFPLQNLFVLFLILVSVLLRVATVAHTGSQPFCQKCRWQ